MRNAITIYQDLTPGGTPNNGTVGTGDEDQGENGVNPGSDGGDPKKNRQLKAVCSCPRIIRMSRKVYEEGVIACLNCKSEFSIDV